MNTNYIPTPEEAAASQELAFLQNARRQAILGDPQADHDPDVVDLRVKTGYSQGTARRIVNDKRRAARRLEGGSEPTAAEVAQARAILARAGQAAASPAAGAKPAVDETRRLIDDIETTAPIDQDGPSRAARKK